MEKNLPRSDVGGGALWGAVGVLAMLLQHDTLFEFDAVSGAIAVIFGAFVSWFVPEHKNFAAAIAGLVGSVGAYLIGKAVFNIEGDVAAFSYALSGLVVAAVGYAIPARNPDGAQPVVEVSSGDRVAQRHPFT